MTNFQKVIPLNEYFRVGVGDQFGVNLPSEARPSTQLLYMAYANFVFEDPQSHLQLQMGGYHANQAYRGKGDGFIMMGLDIPLWKRKIHIIADYIGGDTENSVSVLGVSYLPDPNVAISFGYQPKAANSPASEVIEISIFPGRKKNKKKHR
ncbi:MAG: hypothetical protein KA715_10410 [Xanthomonadaceae bacterium]|nr:hypothetical protein [Xanthomonadaceae bacterium]